ncbi:CshA/CshB family fibrillar adhesin-related protein, partial [Chelativorans sp. M5D2P16]|uniref:CshA/CshB family fibrillar adhesin-related protein n=1 Tax=Chelativorans sp. M5D2P16 TaxID=3095678 RepID=UPI002ACA1212
MAGNSSERAIIGARGKRRGYGQPVLSWISACVALLWLASLAVLSSTPAQAAAYATGGSGQYIDDVLWLTWGGGDQGTHGQPLAVASTTSATLPVAGGINLVVTCSLQNLGGNPLTSYRPGDWSGDSLDNLYNIGGTDTANQLISGIMVANGEATFTVSCNATLGGAPYPLKGLVMADAESIDGTGEEYVQATANGQWFAVEMLKNPGAGEYWAQKSTDGQTIRFGPGTNNNTAAVSFLRFNNPSSNVSMDFAVGGRGNTAIAIGMLAPYADFADAPSSYGEVMHLVADMEFANDNIPQDGTPIDLNAAGYEPGGLLPPDEDYLGTRGPDTELSAIHTPGADGESAAEEDAWPANYVISVLQTGEELTETILCTGTGTVAAWIDFDRSGAFDPDERTEAQCTGTEATLTWTIPETLTPGISYIRLRYSNDASALALPTGTAPDGEVEDHSLTVLAPSLAVEKTSNAVGGSWRVGEPEATYQLTVTNNGPVATGTADNNPPPAEVTVLDELPNGILPDWTGTHSVDGWSCTFSGQLVTCTTSQLFGASGEANDSAQFTLPVQVTADAVGDVVNHASVGGGRDPFNDGDPLPPGDTCTDADHCAEHTITIQPAPEISTVKSSSPASGEEVLPGDSITFTVTTTVGTSETTEPLTLTDTLSDGLTFTAVTAPGPFTSCGAAGQVLTCTLPTSTAPGSYTLEYTATVDADAQGTLTNTVTTQGGGDPDPECTACTTEHPLVLEISAEKTSDLATGTQVSQDDTITYTLAATVTGSATTEDLVLTDTLDGGLT